MLTFPIKVEKSGPGGNLLTIHTADLILGTVGDHNRQTLVFQRDPAFEGDDLCLVFTSTGKAFPEISLGQGNEYLVPNALTQEKQVSLQLIFRKEGAAKASSNILDFALRPAIAPGNSPIEPLPDPLRELIGILSERVNALSEELVGVSLLQEANLSLIGG